MNEAQTNEADRMAPGELRLVQEFLFALREQPSASDIAFADDIRRRSTSGEAQASLARDAGISQRLVSAIVRNKRLVRPESVTGGIVEGLFSPVAAFAWLARRGLIAAGTAVTESDLERLRDLHDALRALTLANNGQPADPAAEAALSRLAAEAPLRLRFVAGHVETEPAFVGGVAGAISRLLIAVADAMRDGTWRRLKTCPAERCLAAFYDSSRNRTGTWCDMAICGNREKVRSYQQRRRRSLP